MTSLVKLKGNQGRGDFFFRDVYQRNAFCAFTGESYSDSSTVYITAEEEIVDCTSQISKYANGVGTLHVYTKSEGATIDKANVAAATVSIDSLATTFRSANTNVQGGFTVNAGLVRADPSTLRVGINRGQPAYTLDVGGDCNVRGNILVHGNLLSLSDIADAATVTTMAPSVTFGTTTPFVYTGPGSSYANALPFGVQTQIVGDAFLTANETRTSFTFTKAGRYLVQTSIQGGYPGFPDGGDVYAFFIKNGNSGQPEGREKLAAPGGDSVASTFTYVLTAEVGDTLGVVVDSAVQNEYEAGIDACQISFTALGGGGVLDLASGNLVLTGSSLGLSGNLSSNAVITTLVETSSLAVSANASTQNLAVLGKLTVNGFEWASSVVYGTNTAFTYVGPGGAGYANGVPFFAQTLSDGTPFVTPGGTDNSVFTFAAAGTYMLQAEIEAGYPWWPEDGRRVTSFYVKNADASTKYGAESHPPDMFAATRPYLMTVGAGDNVRFVMDASVGGEDAEVGVEASRFTILKLA